MRDQNPTVPWYGTPNDWAEILKGVSEGAGSSMQGAAQYATTKAEAKEAKRRTLSNLLNQSLKRNRGLFRAGQEHQDEMNEYQTHALQQVARGFVDALSGSTGRY